jgi:hypothetical protein
MRKSLLAIGVLCVVAVLAVVVFIYPRGQIDEETLFPDPIKRTEVRVEEFAWMVDQFRSEQGRLPQNLEEVIRVRNQRIPKRFAEDAWGNRILYRNRDSVYEIRSLGPDGRSGTNDDVVVTERRKE